MAFLDRLRKAERSVADEAVLARCVECGEEHHVDPDIMFELTALRWYAHHHGGKLPPDTRSDVRWVWLHPCDGLSLINAATGEPIFQKYLDLKRQAELAREDDEE